MSLIEIKKSPLRSLPFLKKRLRRITALGLRNLTMNELNFTVHFTLHRTENTVAFFTSELVENQRNPEWSYLQFPFQVQFLQEFVLRVWITVSSHRRLFLHYDIYLDDSLTPDEQKDDAHPNNNSLWIEMFGYRFTDNPSILINNQKPLPINEPKTIIGLKKSRLNQLMKSYDSSSIKRMIMLIESIRSKKQSSKENLECIQKLVKTNENYLSKIKERESRRVRLENLKQYYISLISIYERRFDSNQYQQKLIYERKNSLENNLLQLLNQREELNGKINHLNQSKCLYHDLMHLIHFRQKVILRDIYQRIYPITVENRIDLTIANLKLPPAEDKSYLLSNTREREYEIETAVGYCAHLVLLMSQFLQIPLRYPIDFYGVPSIKIYDYSLPKSDYPLCPSYDHNLFQYGLYLLNRDIGQIMLHCRVGGRRPNYRKTLQNLKDLMEQYFLNINDQSQIQLFGFTQQSIESMSLSNNNNSSSSSASNTSMTDQSIILRNKRHSVANSIFSPRRSAISSAIEINDDECNNDDDTSQLDLFPTLNSLPPRLTMQFSQIQHQ